jgi:hypothetical protein
MRTPLANVLSLACGLAAPGAPASSAGQGVAGDEPGLAQGRTVARPARALDDGSLRSVFCDLYGRPPLPAERELWLGRGLHALLDELVGSGEFWRHWFDEQLYHLLLIDNFTPSAERVQAIPTDLAGGTLDVREAVHRIALSAGFDRRNPGADTFVTVVMEQLGGLEVQKNTRELEIGKQLYDGHEGTFLGHSGRSQADVIDIVMRSRHFARTFSAVESERFVHALPDPRDLAGWTSALHRDPAGYLALVRGWLLSQASADRLERDVPMPNRLFVRALFVDLLDRAPTEEEAEPLREALDGLSDSAPLRSVLARLLLESGRVPLPAKDAIDDPTAWVSDLFRRLLGREAGQDELARFVAAFHEPACRPQTVIYALISSPEYHVH